MRTLIAIATIFLAIIPVKASNFFGGDIPAGDTLNGRALISCNNGDNTILTTTNNGGLFQGVWFWINGNSSTAINSVKFTTDGGSEKTLATSMTTSSGTDIIQGTIPMAIKFRNSLTVKVNATKTGGTVRTVPIYNLD